MKYVLEHKDAKGQYIAKDMETSFESELDSGDVTEVEQAMQFDDLQDLLHWTAGAGMHKAIMKMKFGKDALVTLDIDEVLENYKPKEILP